MSNTFLTNTPLPTTANIPNFDKWTRLYDNARYLAVEYRHKEKEYGFKWRQAFKEEV